MTKSVVKDTEHFKLSEFKCKHCGKVVLKQALIDMLEKIRVKIGVPITVECGYRCPDHNKAVGGVSNSAHLSGEAADIRMSTKFGSNRVLGAFIKEMYNKGEIPELQYCYLIKGKTRTSVHVGIDKKKRNSVFGF